MILNNKKAKMLWINKTINLKKETAEEYFKNKKRSIKLQFFSLVIMALCGLWVWFLIFILYAVFIYPVSASEDPFETMHNNWIQEELSIQDKIRKERLEVCEDAFINSWIEKNKTNNILNCATMMTLVYAFESNYWTSRMCIQSKNCYWMKGNWIDTPKWNLKFSSFREWSEYFAKKFFDFHYLKTIKVFVYNWAEGNRIPYIDFIESKYSSIYEELKFIYLK